MEILFSMKLKEDGKTIRMEMLCTECQGELEMAAGATSVRFKCRKHGELGTLTVAQFADGIRQAQERASAQYGLEGPVRMRVLPREPTIQ